MIQQKLIFALCLVTFTPILVFATEGIRECPGLPFPQFVNVSECAKVPCPLPRGKTVEMISGFTSGKSSFY